MARLMGLLLLFTFSLAFASPIGFESLDGGKVWKIWNRHYEYYFNASSGIQFTNHYNQYWTHNVFCAGWRSSGANESVFQDDFESWSTTEDCSYSSGWDSCYPGSGMIRGIDGTYAYDGTSLRITDSAGNNELMVCGDISGYDRVWVSFYGRRFGLDLGEYCAMDVRPFGGNWTNIFNSSNGTDAQYHWKVIDVTPYISNYTCVLIYSNANETDEGCGMDNFNVTGYLRDWHYECNDELPFSWSHDTDNLTYVNITGYRDVVVKGRPVRLGLRYHLKIDDVNLTVMPYVRNLGSEDIPNDLGFAWHVNNIRIGMHEENDTILVNGTTYWLNESLSLNFTSLDEPFYKIYDAWTHQWLRLDWSPGLTYRLVLNSTPYQNNTPVRLEINAGPLAAGQEKYTKLRWIDAANLWCGAGSSGTCPTQGNPCTGFICSYTSCDCVVNASQTLNDNVTYYFKSLTVNSGVTLTVDRYPNGATTGGCGGNGLGIAGGNGGGTRGGYYAGGGASVTFCGGNYSGGGGKSTALFSGNGGDGGGKITFNALELINVSGNIYANGEDGTDGSCKLTECGNGGGGGGGGNIHLVARNISLSGTLQAEGGDGGDGGFDGFVYQIGGGGGGGGFIRIAADYLVENSATFTLAGGSSGTGGFGGYSGTAGFYDWLLVRQISPSNGSQVPAGYVTFRFNASSRLESTVPCQITLNGLVIYSNSSVYSDVITEHTETLSSGTKYWNVTCNMTANGTALPTISMTKVLYVTGGDSEPPTYSQNSTNSTTAGEFVEHRLHWEDSGGLSGYVFSFDNCTGNLVNDSWTPFGGESWSNVTKMTNYTVGCTIQWCVYANDTSGNWNGSSCVSPFSYQATSPVYIAISLSPTLQSGVLFGSLDPNTANASSTNCVNRECNITISSDTTVNVDVVLHVGSYLTRWSGSETIEEQYWNSSIATQPASPAYKVQLTYDYTNKVAANVAAGTNITFNSWLSIPSGQLPGLYNNTIYFCATETGTTNC